ncbi:MFS transporter [Streptomyces sp. NBC_00572]|uniref:MFS transporter n=1 Tax=Streptomyces sp. NBC_00572 TaxID=2903664 RepID=UPI00224D5D27|nr:MFS transporter [Streptomyces sp. NBC_00572]MCX4983883.1 MFS transporter [Streptomyces sp. NBC_00572]
MRKRYSLHLYLAGAVAARAGDEMSGPALMLAGFSLAGSATDAASLLAGVTISAAVGGPVLGALLDRARRPGRLLGGALVLYAAGLGAILVGLGHWPFSVTVLIAVLTGLLGPALSGGWTAQLPQVVAAARLPRANALDAMTFSVASLAGSALAGGVAEAMGAPTAVVVAAVLIGVALPAAWALPARPGRVQGARAALVVGAGRTSGRTSGAAAGATLGATSDAASGTAEGASTGGTWGAAPSARSSIGSSVRSVIGDLAAGLRTIVERPPLARATLTSVVSCAAQGMLMACMAMLGERVLGGADRSAVLLSCVAISGLAANAALARSPHSMAPDTIIWAAALVQAAGLALAAVGHQVTLIVAVFIVGVGEGPQLAALFAVRHREAPERLRGQIFTTGASLKITGFALGAAVAGPVAARSLTGALALAASVAVVAALAFLVVPSPNTTGRSGGSPNCRKGRAGKAGRS